MPRSGAEARDRLEQAALALYAERGFEATTAAEIAARAGVTERTFFRHFADKREVVFNAEADSLAGMAAVMAAVPDGVAPFAAMEQAFRARVPHLEANRVLAEARHRVIAATPALRERELAKEAALADVVAAALAGRGVPAARAALLAGIGMAALSHAIHAWTADPHGDIDALIVEAFTDLRGYASVEGAPAREARAARR